MHASMILGWHKILRACFNSGEVTPLNKSHLMQLAVHLQRHGRNDSFMKDATRIPEVTLLLINHAVPTAVSMRLRYVMSAVKPSISWCLLSSAVLLAADSRDTCAQGEANFRR
jgi:hypothetical protein